MRRRARSSKKRGSARTGPTRRACSISCVSMARSSTASSSGRSATPPATSASTPCRPVRRGSCWCRRLKTIRSSASPQRRRLFTRPSGFVFLTPEEASLVAAHCPAPLAPSCIIGTGLEPAGSRGGRASGVAGAVPAVSRAGRSEQGLRNAAAALRAMERTDRPARAARAGRARRTCRFPRTRRSSFSATSTTRARDALLAAASALVVPSPYESLSIVLLEAWNRGTPALVNGGCDVLRGQALRSDGALYYRTYDEFAHAVEQSAAES